MLCRIIFDVADRVPHTALGATALLVLIARAGSGFVVSLRRHVGAESVHGCA
jgi:hypothetical protein